MLGMLHCLVGRRRKMNVKNKMIIYNVIVETLMLYAVPVRCNTTASNILSLERIQNDNECETQGYNYRSRSKTELKIY